MEEASYSPSERERGQGHWGFIMWPPAALILYVLSFGPADWLFGVGPGAVQTFYAPLFWAYKHAPPFRASFDMYMVLWDKNW
jgi:hypothetical protein